MITWGPEIETGNDSRPQLYHMKEAYEQENLAPRQPEKLFELQKLLRMIRAGKGDEWHEGE